MEQWEQCAQWEQCEQCAHWQQWKQCDSEKLEQWEQCAAQRHESWTIEELTLQTMHKCARLQLKDMKAGPSTM